MLYYAGPTLTAGAINREEAMEITTMMYLYVS